MSVFSAAAAVGLDAAANVTGPMVQQVGKLTETVKTVVSMHATGQHPASKRDPINKKDPYQSLSDTEDIMGGVQALIANTLGAVGDDVSNMHKNLSLKLMQPGAMLDILAPGKKPSRDTLTQMELSRAIANATKALATGNGLERKNEADLKAAKMFFRQAGSVIFDTAGVIIQTAITHSVRAMKFMVSATDFDVVADSFNQHVNNLVIGCQKLVWYVAKDFTLSIGGKTKLVLIDQADLVAMKALSATLTEKLELLSAAEIKLKTLSGVSVEANGALLITSGTSLKVGASVPGAGFGINIVLIPDPLHPVPGVYFETMNHDPVLPFVPAPVPNPAVPEVAIGEKMKGPVSTAPNPGKTSSPAHMPHADGKGDLKT